MNLTIEIGAGAARARDIPLCRSLLYEALSLGFRHPSSRVLARLAAADAAAALAEAAALLDEEEDRRPPGRPEGLAAWVRALPGSRDARLLENLLASHLKLFGHTVRGPVPPYETEYGDDTLFQKPQDMSDIAGFLSAFGLALDPSRHERVDHVSCELEFLAFLARKEAHAIETGDSRMLEETRRAERLFLKDHLGRFLPSFAQRVRSVDPDGFYGRLASLALEFVKRECGRFDAPAGPDLLRLRRPAEDGAPVACGAPEGCGVPGPCGAPEDGIREEP